MTASIPLPPSRPTFRVNRRGAMGRLGCADLPAPAAVHVLGATSAGNERLAVQASLRSGSEDTGFDIRWSVAATTCTVTVIGEIDCLTAPSLRDCMLDVLDRPQLGDVVVDLSRVTFLSAAGLAAVGTAQYQAAQTGRVLGLRCGNARAVLRVLEITGLRNVFTIVE